ncbi:MAG: hypothetical protein KJ792_04835 [Actinobacteria bacterium]|nr:hypothetical protein [Actinomycetota bacterium]MCG2801830.1 hypothetical protein [Cellulomonas sp.]
MALSPTLTSLLLTVATPSVLQGLQLRSTGLGGREVTQQPASGRHLQDVRLDQDSCGSCVEPRDQIDVLDLDHPIGAIRDRPQHRHAQGTELGVTQARDPTVHEVPLRKSKIGHCSRARSLVHGVIGLNAHHPQQGRHRHEESTADTNCR